MATSEEESVESTTKKFTDDNAAKLLTAWGLNKDQLWDDAIVAATWHPPTDDTADEFQGPPEGMLPALTVDDAELTFHEKKAMAAYAEKDKPPKEKTVAAGDPANIIFTFGDNDSFPASQAVPKPAMTTPRRYDPALAEQFPPTQGSYWAGSAGDYDYEPRMATSGVAVKREEGRLGDGYDNMVGTRPAGMEVERDGRIAFTRAIAEGNKEMVAWLRASKVNEYVPPVSPDPPPSDPHPDHNHDRNLTPNSR